MGYEKHQLEVKEQGWQHVARNNNWRCSMCNIRPPLCDREIYLRTGMCGYCDHVLNNGD